MHDIIQALAVALLTPWFCRMYFHILQLEGYKPQAYLAWLAGHLKKAVLPPVVLSVAAIIIGLVLSVFIPIDFTLISYIVAALLLVGLAAWGWLHKKTPAKKPLVMTMRAKRLCLATAIIIFFIAWVNRPLAVLSLPVLVYASAAFMLPLEKRVNAWYFNDAKKKIDAMQNLIKIGITGSFGKTSSKFILGTILSEKFKVLITHSSFNTPMGISKVIREQLTGDYEVFIAEMGAKHKGDIAELCSLVNPKIGLITSVGLAHIETFGSIETIASTKYELIQGLTQDGVGVFMADSGGWVDNMYRDTKNKGKLRAGLNEGMDGLPLDMTARNIQVGAFGSRFDLVDKEGQSISCQTKMLGYHNIGNIILCCAAARHLGLSMQQIAAGIAKIEPVEHRLQLLPSPAGLIIIDDAFNANPVGTRAALDVLSMFEGKKIIITPGLVELGDMEDEENKAFGAAMADVCDEVILVGAHRAEQMQKGLKIMGFADEKLHIVNSLDEAVALLPKLAKPGDAVLFENDLPDNM